MSGEAVASGRSEKPVTPLRRESEHVETVTTAQVGCRCEWLADDFVDMSECAFHNDPGGADQ